RGYAFGFLKSMDTVGAIIGPLLGLLAFGLLSRSGVPVDRCYRYVFFFAALPTLGSISLILTKTREVRKPEQEKPAAVGGSAPEETNEEERLFASPGLLPFTVASAFFSLWAVTENFLILCAVRLLRIRHAAVWPVVILYWFINVSFAPVALYAGRLSDRIGRKPPIVLGLVVLAGLTTAFGFVPEVSGEIVGSIFVSRAFLATTVLFLLHGAYQGLLKPTRTAFVADLAVGSRRGETLGVYSMATGAAAVAAPLIFGLLWDAFSYRTPFIISGICVGVSAVVVALLVPERGRSE
ncbi:MAG: MFS transporter, partial [Armatimonadota bacterium]